MRRSRLTAARCSGVGLNPSACSVASDVNRMAVRVERSEDAGLGLFNGEGVTVRVGFIEFFRWIGFVVT